MGTYTFKKGNDATIVGTVTSSGSAYDITGYTFTLKVYNGTREIISKDAVITNAAGGIFTITLTDEELDINAKTYTCHIDMTDDSAKVTTIDGGNFIIQEKSYDSGTTTADDSISITAETGTAVDLAITLDATVATLNDIGNVTITTIASDEILKWNGTAWINNTLAEAGIQAAITDSDDITEGTTNLFMTTTERSKLSGIDDGAEVNNISDANATDLTDAGDSILHYHATDRARANHTGTQAASTISDFDTEVSNKTDVSANTSARHSAVTVLDSSEIDFTLTGQQITASIIAGSIDETKLDVSTNASLDLADSSLQSGDNISVLTNDSGYITDVSGDNLETLNDVTITTIASGELLKWNGTAWINNTLAEAGIASASDLTSHTGDATIHFTEASISITASQVSDFDTEVSNNTDVAANTSVRHDAVTVTDSSEINFTLTGQDLTASLIASSIDETKLDASVNASLDLADSALQSGDNITVLDGTANRVIYIDGTGDVTELALGASGTYLQSQGATGTPTWSTPAGSGDVSKVGTPVDNQIAVWTGDGTVEGDANFTWNGTALGVTGNITVSGTVDGVDVAALKTDVDGFNDELKNLSAAEIDYLEALYATGVTSTEFDYLDGVTSAIQTQLNTKLENLSEDTTPELGGELDAGAHSIGFTLTDNGNSGTADTIVWTNSNKQKSTLTGNCTFTFTAPSNPCSLQLIITNNATGGYDITWPASVKWLGTEPTWTDGGASKTIIVSFLYDGTNYWAQGTPWEV
jgi:hypothetical protein